MLNWKVNPEWYLFSLTFAFIISCITLLLKGIYYGEGYASFLELNYRDIPLRAFIGLLLWAFLGEVVWVSYCVRELSKITKPFYAGQIVAFFWTLWLIPIALLGEGVFPDIPILSLLIFMMGTAGMCAFIYSQTKSGIGVLILQYMQNLTLSSLPVTPTNGGAPTYTAYSIIYFLAMLSFVYYMYPIKKAKIVQTA